MKPSATVRCRVADRKRVRLYRFLGARSPARSVGGTDHRLWAPASVALESLLTAARRAGVQIGINDSYRSYAEQVDMVRRKELYSQGGFSAKPGTSDHGRPVRIRGDTPP